MQGLHVILFILYGALLTYFVKKIPFFRRSNIKSSWLIAFFWIRVSAAIVHNYVAYLYYPNRGDIWFFFEQGKKMKADLLISPSLFYSNYFSHYFDGSLPANSFLERLQYTLIEHINMFLNFVSFNNIHINSLIFSFITFAGSIALFRVFMNAFRQHLLTALTTLLIPSVLFWTACIHKEGILLFLLGVFLLLLQRQLASMFTMKGVASLLVILVFIFLFRNYFVFSLFISVIAWIMAERTELKKRSILLLIAGASVMILIVAALASDSFNIFHILAAKHDEFRSLEGGSRIYFLSLEPNFISFLQAFPYAILNGFFQPLPGFGGKQIYNLFSLELILIWGLTGIACFMRRKERSLTGFEIFCIVFSIINLFIIGYTIPFVGAIIRYRSLYLPFVLAIGINLVYHKQITKKINSWATKKMLVLY